MNKYSPMLEDEYYKLWILLHQVRDLILKARTRELARADISMIEAGALFVLANSSDPMTPAEMSRSLLREIHSTSTLLQRMEEKGLINKTKNLHYKHLIRLTLTKKGRIAYEQTINRETIHRILSSLSGAQIKQLNTSLRKLRAAAAKEAGIKYEIRFP